MDKVIPVDFENELPGKFSEVVCLKCLHRYIASRPATVLLRDLDCKTCGPGFIIETGEEMK